MQIGRTAAESHDIAVVTDRDVRSVLFFAGTVIAAAVVVLVDAHQVRGAGEQIVGEDVLGRSTGIQRMQIGRTATVCHDAAVAADSLAR